MTRKTQPPVTRVQLRRMAHKARNISDPSARAIALRKVSIVAKDILDHSGG